MVKIPIKSQSASTRPTLKLGRNMTSKLFTQLLSADRMSSIKDFFDIGWRLSLIAGVLWNGFYYAFIANVLPNINLGALPAVLVGTFFLGALITALFLLVFLLPGLIIYSGIPKEYSENQFKTRKLIYAGFFCALGLITISLIGHIILSPSGQQRLFIGVIGVTFLTVAILFILAILRDIPGAFSETIKLEFKSFLWLFSAFAWTAPLLISLLAARLLESAHGYAPYALSGFAVVILAAVITNYGISFHQRRSLFVNIAIASLIVINVITTLTPSDRPNLFLTAPYRILKIGQVHARLTFDKSFEQQSPMFTECSIPKKPSQTYDLFVIDSIGSEYIIECTGENKKKRVIKIPKKAIVQVMYGD